MKKVSLRKIMIAMGIAASLSLFAADQAVTPKAEPKVMTNEAQQDCEKLMKDPFPDLIVEKVLTSNGISPSEVKEITGKLDAAAATIPDRFAKEYAAEDEPIATNDPLSDVYDTESLDNVRLEVFRDVMKEYISDAELAMKMFNEINTQREAAVKACSGMELKTPAHEAGK